MIFRYSFTKYPIAILAHLRYNASVNGIVFPWLGIAQDEYPAEQENGVQVPALPAL